MTADFDGLPRTIDIPLAILATISPIGAILAALPQFGASRMARVRPPARPLGTDLVPWF
jgi:hypothetical protein